MNVDKLIDEIIIDKTKEITYNDRLEIIEEILEKQLHLPKHLDTKYQITALGLQTLSDKDLIYILHNTYIAFAVKCFTKDIKEKE